jgi:transposase
MIKVDDLSRSPTALDQEKTRICVVELSRLGWLIAGMLPGIHRQPLKMLEPDPVRLRWTTEHCRDDAVKASRTVTRIVFAYEAGRDGFWLARWLRAQNVEAHVIHLDLHRGFPRASVRTDGCRMEV